MMVGFEVVAGGFRQQGHPTAPRGLHGGRCIEAPACQTHHRPKRPLAAIGATRWRAPIADALRIDFLSCVKVLRSRS